MNFKDLFELLGIWKDKEIIQELLIVKALNNNLKVQNVGR